jgi:signal transduction histidine kinase
VRLPEFARTATFRSTLLRLGAYAVSTVLIFAIVLWQTSSYLTSQVDRLITEAAKTVAGDEPLRSQQRLEDHLRADPKRVKLGGLFGIDGNRIAGNIQILPRGLAVDMGAQTVSIARIDSSGREVQTARAVAERLSDGRTLVIGRSLEEVTEVTDIVEGVVALGLVAALGLGLAAGAWLSMQSQKRIEEINERIQRIVAGELQQRLPTRGTDDPLDKLTTIVNGMLDEIEALVQSLAGVGDDIAHDLRTPLARVRIGLERARANAKSLPDLQSSVDQAIMGVDQAISIITALLRIREIEQTRRIEGFDDVKLAELVREVGDLYEPFAEEKRLALNIATDSDVTVRGDRDLLFEAVANLVDNAVKFTPEGGRVEVRLTSLGSYRIVRVSDTGPGVADGERELLVQRFYRSDHSRHTKGLGLGLSLVAAIVKLHGFRFSILPGPGFVAEITFLPTRA